MYAMFGMLCLIYSFVLCFSGNPICHGDTESQSAENAGVRKVETNALIDYLTFYL